MISSASSERMREKLRGRAIPPEVRLKISKTLAGMKKSELHRLHISEAKRGEKHPMFGTKLSEENKIKLRLSRSTWTFSEDAKARLSISKKGEKNPQWRGGISFEPYCVKFNREFRSRVRAFFGFRCVECGKPEGKRKLSVHHVNFNKGSCCDSTTPLFVSLCTVCHSKTNFNREYWEKHFTEIINRNYGGKCYLPKHDAEELIKAAGVQ